MKTVRGKLFMAAAALGLAAASTIGSTYAWFTTQSQANVNNLQMTVTSGDGLTIKDSSASSYGSKIDYADSDATYGALTTVDGKNFYTLTDDRMTDDKTAFLYETAENGFLTKTVDVMFTKGLNLKISTYTCTRTDSLSSTTSAVNAVRVAAYVGSTGATIYRLNGTSDTRTEDYALDTFNTFFGAAVTETGKLGGVKTGCKQFTTGDSDKWKPAGVDDFSTATFITKSITEDTDNPGFAKTSITFNLWFEGNDYDCSNGIFNQSIKFGFTLTTVAA